MLVRNRNDSGAAWKRRREVRAKKEELEPWVDIKRMPRGKQ